MVSKSITLGNIVSTISGISDQYYIIYHVLGSSKSNNEIGNVYTCDIERFGFYLFLWWAPTYKFGKDTTLHQTGHFKDFIVFIYFSTHHLGATVVFYYS